MKKTAYHITSRSNWQNIMRRGLKPQSYSDGQPVWNDIGPVIWAWPTVPEPRKFLGHVVHRMIRHGGDEIVLISWDYWPWEPYRTRLNWSFTHDGCLKDERTGGTWEYHRKTPALIFTRKVRPHRLRLVAHFDFERVVRESLGV